MLFLNHVVYTALPPCCDTISTAADSSCLAATKQLMFVVLSSAIEMSLKVKKHGLGGNDLLWVVGYLFTLGSLGRNAALGSIIHY